VKLSEKIFRSFAYLPSKLWEKVYELRRGLYNIGYFQSHRYAFPVISIGNLSMGGTGKTPLTLWLCEYLVSRGLNPLIVMRGYKSKKENSYGLINPANKFAYLPSEYGDEPLMLARGMTGGYILVGKNRKENLEKYYQKIKPDVVILDDGFQHLKIHRDLNLLLFDGLMPKSRYHAPPLGYLREGVKAIHDADVLLFSRGEFLEQKKFDDLLSFFSPFMNEGTGLVKFNYSTTSLQRLGSKEEHTLDYISEKNVIPICAIASPQAYLSSIKNAGANVVKEYQFPDHHFYTQSELDAIIEESKKHDAILICTEKDAVKFESLKNYHHLMVMKVEISFLQGESVLRARIDQLMNEYRL
jgi:tetraacyldisaccharide 4'-kinase